ncbi:EAL domain-containing protein [Actinocorallia longicatena]|uniref:EAL domain-containing protein n=1 Tax=Actinocorallia longicatena TaxID=111803 RepID=A0ABP6Q9L9_9ACTN
MALLDTLPPTGLSGGALFQPVVDLDSGSVVAVETHVGPSYADPGPVDAAQEDIRRAVDGARALASHSALLPMQIMVRAETVALGRAVLTVLHQGLYDAGRRPQEVIICVTGGFAPAQRAALAAGVQDLRHAGYLVAFGGLGTTHAPLDLLVEGTPYLVKLDPELARKAISDQRRSALVEALVTLAHRVGTHVLAPGIDSEDQLKKLRGLGVRLVQGPLLTPPDWRPGQRVPIPVPVSRDEPPTGSIDLGPRVSEFTLPAMTMPDTVTAGAVLDALSEEQGTTSIVLVDGQQRPRHTVDRARFLLALSGAYGHALHSTKPASRLADPPRIVPKTVPAIAALRAAGRDEERVYDDLVVTDEIGRCLGIVRVSDLIRNMSP